MKTTDLCDKYDTQLHIAEPIGFRSFGRRSEFHGRIETVKCHEDNSFVRAALEKDGAGKVLVVDGGASLRCALLGDNMADLAYQNHWAGIIVYGCIRDSVAISQIGIGVLALGTHPRKSAKDKQGVAGVPVRFAGVVFTPGEFVYVDEDGVVTSREELLP
ncbi:MAG TPA: ribonuclease E activity regulator RraA [Anaerolineales bacterium]|nr:ribonuclease E activity regulator RraA [Anaerolineales bacterium]HNF36991.1 ribonuclease E activity regulator RraA [Anaerolineales bacterium]